jgi:hypothetical protein
VAKGHKELILQAIEEDFVFELQAQQTGYLNVTPFQIMTHLRMQWGSLDFVDITALMTECDSVWSPAEVSTKYFNCIDKERRKLARVNVQIDERAMMLKALKSFKDASNYDAPIREWDARLAATQTYANLKTMMSMEYSKLNCQDGVTARATGHASANAVQEFPQAKEELVAELKEKHSKQIEALIKSNSEAIAKLTAALLEDKAPAAAPAALAVAQTTNAKQSKRAWIWAKKKRNAMECPHCNKFHPNQIHSQCWELEANASKQPAGWKLSKSNQQGMGFSVETEMQVAGKVDKQCTHSANANYWAPLSNYDDNDDDNIEGAQHVNIRNSSDREVQHNLQTMILTWINQRIDKSKHFVQKASKWC